MDSVCYGFNLFGQICSGNCNTVLSQLKSLAPVASIKCIAFGWSRCYIVLGDGSVIFHGFCNSQARHRRKLETPFQSSVKKVTCLRRYDLLLAEDGSCWKYTLSGQWAELKNLIPSAMKKANVKIIDVVSSDELHLALSDKGHLFSFPLCIDIPFHAKVKKASCGLEHYVCLLENGSVFVWGSGSRGQLGNNSLNTSEQPELLIPLDGLIVVDIDAGGWHSAAITISGDLYVWGWNNCGQLGVNVDENATAENDSCVSVISEPLLVSYFDNSNVSFRQVACGTNHTLVLMDDGLVWGCGSNKYGQINPASKQQCFYRMTRVPLPLRTDSVTRIFCASWNSIIIFKTYFS